MKDIKKWFAAPEFAPVFEIDAHNLNQATEYIKDNFRGSGEVRLLEVDYRQICTTPHIIKTK